MISECLREHTGADSKNPFDDAHLAADVLCEVEIAA